MHGNVWKCYICNISLKGYSTQKDVSGEPLEPKLRPCSWNKNSVNENKKSYIQIDKTVSVGLDIHWGEAPNTKQKKYA